MSRATTAGPPRRGRPVYGPPTPSRPRSQIPHPPTPIPTAAGDPPVAGPRRVAYVAARFPVVSQTFVINEIAEMRRQGVDLEIHALFGEGEPVEDAHARELARETRRYRPLTPATLRAHAGWARARPRAYLGVWAGALRGAGLSPRRLVAAVATVVHSAPFAAALRRGGVDHVHAHFATHAALAAWAARRLTGIPYSVTAHSHDLTIDASMLPEKLGEARFAAVVSDYYRRWLRPLLPEATWRRVRIVRCGVDTAALTPRPRRERRPDEPATILCPARLTEVKGHRYLLEAVALLRSGGLDARLVLAGDGALRDALVAQARGLGIDDAVRLTGRVSHELMLRLMTDADVVALPSATTVRGEREGIPVSLMEAMALGAPVVATAISGVPELVEDGRSGLLVPERDVPALARALRRVLSEPLLAARLAAGARARVEAEYSLAANCARLRELIGSGVAAARPAAERGAAAGSRG